MMDRYDPKMRVQDRHHIITMEPRLVKTLFDACALSIVFVFIRFHVGERIVTIRVKYQELFA